MNLSRLAPIAAAAALSLAASGALAQDRTGWPNSVTIGTASIGGTYYVYGGGWASIIQDVLGVSASVENTGGPTANATLVDQGQLLLGMVTMGPAYEAWTGNSPAAPGHEHKDMRALFPMYETPFHMVTLRASGIDTVEELNGRTIGTGPAAGTAGGLVPQFLADLGINATYRNASWSDLSTQMTDGLLDGIFFGAGIPIPSVMEVEAQQPINIFSFNDEERARLLEAYPFLADNVIPAATYNTLQEDLETIAIWNFAIGNKDLPETFVYEMVKAIHENHERLVQTHSSAAATLPENVTTNGFLWMHPGAVRYYREQGIDIPEELIPPEMQG